jgi:hypothetical protein
MAPDISRRLADRVLKAPREHERRESCVQYRQRRQAGVRPVLPLRQGDVSKDRRLNIRLSSKDLEAIQKRALAEGLPYQTLISSLLHKLRVWTAQGSLAAICMLASMAAKNMHVLTIPAPLGEYPRLEKWKGPIPGAPSPAPFSGYWGLDVRFCPL